MNNLISKSQSLFLVAILAIFPSANAFSSEEAAQIDEQMQKIYDNLNKKRKALKIELDAFKLKINEDIKKINIEIEDLKNSNNIKTKLKDLMMSEINPPRP